jgi:hypothetical protein
MYYIYLKEKLLIRFTKFVLNFSVQIEDLPGKGSYIVNVNSSVCWDNNSTCNYNVRLFENIQLPKPDCNMDKDYIING